MRIATSSLAGVALLVCTSAALATTPTPTNVEIIDLDKPAIVNQGSDPIELNVGGDTIATATPIPSLPYSDSGNTCTFINDYDYACPYTGSTSRDVVYRYSPTTNVQITVDLCTSLYDTKVYIYQNVVGTPIACNDDICGSDGWKSRLDCVPLTAGNNYYIVVDGYGGACGTYYITVTACVPCVVDCPPGSQIEGEPDCYAGYNDVYNGGCNSVPPVWTTIPCDPDDGVQTICGKYGGFLVGTANYRDTDWYEINLTDTTTISWTVEGEYPTLLGIIDGRAGCPVTAFYASATTAACVPATVTRTLPPGRWWLFVATSAFGPSAGACGGDYTARLNGYLCPPVAIEPTSWGDVKALHR